jgi:hypothetical protein
MEQTMFTRLHRITVVGCALSWLLVGMHLPALDAMTHPGHAPHWEVVIATALLAVAAVAGLWALLRTPARSR